MRAMLRRLESGERWWAAEAVIRVLGIALLVLCVAASWWLYRSVQTPPPHPASAIEFAGATTAVVSFSIGSAFAVEGAGLFAAVPLPPRTLISLKTRGA